MFLEHANDKIHSQMLLLSVPARSFINLKTVTCRWACGRTNQKKKKKFLCVEEADYSLSSVPPLSHVVFIYFLIVPCFFNAVTLCT